MSNYQKKFQLKFISLPLLPKLAYFIPHYYGTTCILLTRDNIQPHTFSPDHMAKKIQSFTQVCSSLCLVSKMTPSVQAANQPEQITSLLPRDLAKHKAFSDDQISEIELPIKTARWQHCVCSTHSTVILKHTANKQINE